MSVTVNGSALKKMIHDGNTVRKWIHDGVTVWQGDGWINLVNPNQNASRSDLTLQSYWMPMLSRVTSEGSVFERLSNGNVKVLYPLNVTIEAWGKVGSDAASGWSAMGIYANGTDRAAWYQVSGKRWNDYTHISYNYNAKAGDIIQVYGTGSGGAQYVLIQRVYIKGVVA